MVEIHDDDFDVLTDKISEIDCSISKLISFSRKNEKIYNESIILDDLVYDFKDKLYNFGKGMSEGEARKKLNYATIQDHIKSEEEARKFELENKIEDIGKTIKTHSHIINDNRVLIDGLQTHYQEMNSSLTIQHEMICKLRQDFIHMCEINQKR